MKREPTELSSFFPYHVCARSNNKDWFEIPLSTVFNIYLAIIKKTKEKYNFKFHNFVLMGNHFHFLVTTPDENLPLGMRFFMTESSKWIARSSDRINRIYGARYSRSIIKNEIYYSHAFRYVLQNPLRAQIIDEVTKYPWSSLTNIHMKALMEPANNIFNFYIPQKDCELYLWLNQNHRGEHIIATKNALRKKEFKFSKSMTSKKIIDYKHTLTARLSEK